MQKTKNFVTIIMVTYNSVSKLHSFFDKVIRSLIDLNYDNYVVIVVDNNSRDYTINHIKELMRGRETRILVVKLRENKGLPYAYNVGAIIAVKFFPRTKYFLFINDDVILSKDAISTLIEDLEKAPCDAIQPIIMHLDGHKEVGFRMGITGYVKPIGYEEMGPAPLVKVPVIAGAALMVKRDVFFNVGMFDGDMFWGYDDVDFCWRLHKHGYDTCVTKRTYVVHYGSATWGKENPIKYYYGVRNHIYMYYKNKDFVNAIIHSPILLLEILKILHWKLSRRVSRGVKAILLGIIDGVYRIPKALKNRGIPQKTYPTYFDLNVDIDLLLGKR